MNSISVVVPAGGSGLRFDSREKKQFVVHEGWTLLRWSIQPFMALGAGLEHLVVAVPAGCEADPGLQDLPCRVHVVTGGPRRQDSIKNGLNRLRDLKAGGIWLVHDAARPLVASQDIDRLVGTIARHHCGALLAGRVRETIKRSADGMVVDGTVDREPLWLAHTPQGAPADLLWRAYELAAGATVTDDAALLEAAGIPVRLVESAAANIKVTSRTDWDMVRPQLRR